MFSSVSLQDAWSPLMGYVSGFHDHVMVVLVLIVSVVGYVFVVIISYPCYGRMLKSSEGLETMWTVLPCVVLVSMATPSLMTLYLSDEVGKPSVLIKVVGHQWYWSYEYEDLDRLVSIDSFMIPSKELMMGDFRLLEVDKSVKVPVGVESRVYVSSSDVIHSWTVPSMGVKVDAVPGRLNQLVLLPLNVGKIYGQCSEICGSLHSFMPISVEVVSKEDFLDFLKA